MLEGALIGALWSAVSDTVKTAVQDVAGSSARGVAAGLKSRIKGRLPLPQNHDLVRGIRTAQIAALDRVARRYEARVDGLPAEEIEASDRVFAARLRAFIRVRLDLTTGVMDHAALDEQTVARVLDDMVHPSDVEGFAAAARGSRALAEADMLADLEADADATAPLMFRDMFYGREGIGWYDVFALFVNEEIKTNKRFQAIFFAAEFIDLKRVMEAAEARIGQLVGSGVDRIEAGTARIEEKVHAVKEDTERLIAFAEAERQRLGVAEGFIHEMAGSVAAASNLDLAGKMQAVRAAIALYADEIAGGRTETNLGEIVDRALSNAQSLANAGRSALARQALRGTAERLCRSDEEHRREEVDRRGRQAESLRALFGRERDIALAFFDPDGAAEAVVALAGALHPNDPKQVTLAIWEEAQTLQQFGDEKGSNVHLLAAIGLWRGLADSDPAMRGQILTGLGNALQILGARESGTIRLEEAIRTYEQALKEQSRRQVPLDWARTQSNLGVALERIAQRESGTERFLAAIAAHKAALEERKRERAAEDWATTQINLGIALMSYGERAGEIAHLEDAVTAFTSALEVHTQEVTPLLWGRTQHNLGTALKMLGEHDAGTTRLLEAVVAYRAALSELTRERVPLMRATTHHNLGRVLVALAHREGGTARLLDAIEQYRSALMMRTRECVPLDWALTQQNLGDALVLLGIQESGTARFQEAVQAYRRALEERTRKQVPLKWAQSYGSLGVGLLRIAERQGDAIMAREATAAIAEAREEVGGDPFLAAWLDQQGELARVLIGRLASNVSLH